MPHDLISFVVATAVILVVPGPDFVLVTRHALSGGRRAGFTTMAGILSGLSCHVVLAAVGLSALIAASSAVFTVVRVVGAAYLIGLGLHALVESFRRRRSGAGADSGPPGEQGPGPEGPGRSAGTRGRSRFAQGGLNNLLNPKAIVFFLSFLPQFLDPGAPVVPQIVVLGTLTVVLAGLWWTVYISLIAQAAVLLRRPSVRRGLDRLAGAVLIGLGARLLAE